MWRYILAESPNKVPKMHLGLMLETWRALASLVEHHVWGNKCRTLADYLENYIVQGVFHDAQMDKDGQAASQDENSGVEFSEIRDWLHHKGRALEAGLDLFNLHARGTGDSVEASPLLRRVLLRAAGKTMNDPLPTCRGADIAMFRHRICYGGLIWNAAKGVFELLFTAPGRAWGTRCL